MAYDPYNHPIKRKHRVWPWALGIGIAALVALCGFAALASTPEVKQGLVTVTGSGSAPAPAPTVTVTVTVKAAPPAVAKTATTKPKPAQVTIDGDDLVHVGEDVPPGTYRASESVAGMTCYWAKTKDAEGADIIDNDIPSGGRPQVTLKKGQWFTTSRCATWVKK